MPSWNGTSLSDIIAHRLPPRNIYVFEIWQGRTILDNKRTAKAYGDKAFAKSGPELWNALPLNIRNSSSVTAFKSSIKTHYYKICYVWKTYERTLKLYYEHC